MKFSPTDILLRTTLSIIFLFIPTFIARSENSEVMLEQVLRQMGVSMQGVEGFAVLKDFSRGASKQSFRSIFARHDQNVIKIEVTGNMEKDYASQFINEKKYIINSLYNRILSAYPGMISNTIESPKEYKPVTEYIENDPSRPVMLLFSTARYTYGASTEDLIKFRAALVFNYCERSRTLYRVEYFVPKEDFDKEKVLAALAAFSCHEHGEEMSSLGQAVNSGIDYLCKDCNVVFIGWEPLGANHLNLYGYDKKTSPRLDQLARQGIVFRNAISVSSWTLPVFISMFTSLYPSEHKLTNKYRTYNEKEQVLSNLKDLSPNAVTLAQVLKKNGYVTGGFTGGAALGREFGFDLGFDRYEDKFLFGGFDDVFPGALKWIKKNKDKKFFAFILGYDVHGRYPLPKDHTRQFIDPGYKGKFKGTPDEYWQLRNNSIDLGQLDLTDRDIQFWRDWYDTKIFESDKRFGEFLDKLKTIIDLNRTVFVITSASGNEFYEHKIFDHGHGLYDELIRVPLVFKIPAQKPGQVDDQVRVIDIMPTVLDILGVHGDEAVNRQLRGVNLVPFMRGEHKNLYAFSETDYLLQFFKRSVRSPDGWKLIYSMDTEERELYNIINDPMEQKNLISERPEIAYELEQKLFDWLKNLGQDKNYHGRLINDVLTSP